MRFDTIWRDARLATLDPARPGLGVVENGAIAARDGRIAFVGSASELPLGCDAQEQIALDGRWVTPGLIDCHTHLVHGGDRAHEFELRLAGASYEEIARAGGGILSTVRATRAGSEDDLVATALPRLDRLLAEGVTTVEIKSGYGLERRQRSAHASGCTKAATSASHQRGDVLPRRPRVTAGSRRLSRWLSEVGLRPDPHAGATRSCRRGRCLL